MSGTVSPAATTARAAIKRAFSARLVLSSAAAGGLIGQSTGQDKLYELKALLETMDRLPGRVWKSFHLIGASSPRFRYKGGKIIRHQWPHIQMRIAGQPYAELWNNIEFASLSAIDEGRQPGYPTYADTHELDIIVTKIGQPDGYPRYDELKFGVEVKDRPYNKELLKALLGVRREMAYVFSGHGPAGVCPFAWWPMHGPGAVPDSALVAFASGGDITKYDGPEARFGLKMVHLP
ncbi:MAG: hypothetical protein JWR84_1703 [Caulobacter sp.]|nr:hypothetical protein [Caulobacter sp.]